MSRESKFVKNTLILSIGTFLPKLASFITLPIITNYLTKAEYGTYDLVTVLVSLLLPVATLQIQTAAFRFLIDVRDVEEKVKRIITNIMVFVIPVSLVTLAVVFFVLKLSMLTRFLVCLYLFFDILVNVVRQIVRGLGKNHFYSVSSVLNSLLMVAFVPIFIYWKRMGLEGVLISCALSCILSLIYVFFKAKLHLYLNLSLIDGKIIKQLLAYSWPMVPNSMSMWVMRLSDRFVITMIMGIEANAVYAVANKIPHLLTLAQNTFSMAWQENASIVASDSDVAKYYSDMYRRIFRFMAGCMGLLIAATPVLFSVLIKGDYDEAKSQIPILILSMFFSSLSAYMGGIYVAFMKTKSVGITTIISALINLVTNFGMIHWIGLYAASVSTLISYVFLTLYRMSDVKKIVKIEYKWVEMIFITCILIAQCYIYTQGTMPFYILNCVIGVAVFFAFNMEIIQHLFNKLFNKVK